MVSPTKEDMEFILCYQQINDRPLPIYIQRQAVPCLVKSTSSDNINSPKGNGQQALVRLQEQLCLMSILTFRNFLLSCLQKAEKRQKHCATLFRIAAIASHTVSSKDGAASFYSEEDKKCPKGIRSNYRDWPAQADKLERYTT